MRKLNAFITVIIFILFALHAVFGAFVLFGVSNNVSKILGWITLGFVSLHALIGIYLTVKSLVACHKSGAPYFKDNLLFWAKRISGFLIMAFIVFHILAFNVKDNRLPEFNMANLILNILLGVTVGIHALMNVKPVLISLGLRELKPYTADIYIVICAVLVLSFVAFIYYYYRWVR